ncbi:hypothetical protein J4233_01715 [Candidatus Pacearchaeota archaeon]|nr:hypothetical protein [Candidatus Pacearchaeota archaeon]
MTVMDEVVRMQSQGMNQDQIASQLRARGMPEQEVANVISQSQIKQAVAGAGSAEQNLLGQGPSMNTSFDQTNPMPPNQFPGEQQAPSPFGDYVGQFGTQSQTQNQQGQNPQTQNDSYAGFGSPPSPGQESYGAYSAQAGDPYGAYGEGVTPETGEYAGMQPSMLSQGAESGEYAQVGGGGQGAVQEPYGAEAYPAYQPYQEAMSSDMITEISEQVVNERLSSLHDKIEKIIDMRTIVEANMTNLNDRLKRMEKIVDQMQVSILKKVGEYMTDIQDVKNELEETQKSFVAIHKTKKKGNKK